MADVSDRPAPATGGCAGGWPRRRARLPYFDPVTHAVRDAYSSISEQYISLFDGTGREHQEDAALVRRHLTGLDGPVLDLGCGPGHWTADLHSWGAAVTGVDVVPEFIAHAQAVHPGPDFQLGSMTELDTADHSIAGILAWYSTIHLPPSGLDRVLHEFRRLLAPDGVLVVGFFASDGDVAPFEHQVITAYRWPVNIFVEHLLAAGFVEEQRRQHQVPERPDRMYAAVAARAS
ncbi:class I SAM-dependent methyltransferase [Microlunatus lacustris]